MLVWERGWWMWAAELSFLPGPPESTAVLGKRGWWLVWERGWWFSAAELSLLPRLSGSTAVHDVLLLTNIISKQLQTHVRLVIKASGVLLLIDVLRSFKMSFSYMDRVCFLILYNTFIRPHLECLIETRS
jgi:hypothetical protein